jgi:HEAT repeat protein
VDKSTLQIVLASVAISFGLGFGLAWSMRAPGPESTVTALAAQPRTATPVAAVSPNMWAGRGVVAAPALPANASVDELWARALAPQDGYDAEDRLRKLAQSNPVALRSLLQRYDSTQAPQVRELLKSILSTVQAPDVVAFSTRLANSSNAAERKFGFELLQSVAPDSPEVRSIARRTLASEQSPEVLVQALAALKSGVAEPEEADQIVAQLKSLSQHADAAVRSQSIAQLGQWDKKGEGAELLLRAMADPAPEVRQSAIFAIAQNGLRSEPIKAALLGVMNNPQESKEVRGSALQVLERFSLSREEYVSVNQARTRMQTM